MLGEGTRPHERLLPWDLLVEYFEAEGLPAEIPEI